MQMKEVKYAIDGQVYRVSRVFGNMRIEDVVRQQIDRFCLNSENGLFTNAKNYDIMGERVDGSH